MKRAVTFFVTGVVCFLALGFWASSVHAANPATINVTVTIQNLSVSATGPIAFGVVAAATATISSDSSHVVNDGNVTETYSLNLTDPGGWTAVQAAPGAEEYCLSVQFNSDEPSTFTYADHALSTTSTACSATKFAGDQDGVSVATSGARYLWFKFEAPSTTTVTTEQTIVVTVTAAAG